MSNQENVERGGTRERTGYSSYPHWYNDSETSEKRWTSWLIPLFVVANIVVFIVTMYVNNCPEYNVGFEGRCVPKFLGRLSFQPLRENLLFGPSASGLLKMGALERHSVVHWHEGWRLVTCIWLHSSVNHLIYNTLTLVSIGIRLEQQFGFLKIGVIYLFSGFGGAILSTLFLHHTISVGASGAMFGLFGAIISELLTNWAIYTNKAAPLLLKQLFFIIVANLAVGFLPIMIDNFVHIGGFLTGFLLGFVLLALPQFGWVNRRQQPVDHSRFKSKHKAYQYIYGVVALVLLIVGITMGLVMLFRGVNGNDHCSWCHYLKCVPTSIWNCDY